MPHGTQRASRPHHDPAPAGPEHRNGGLMEVPFATLDREHAELTGRAAAFERVSAGDAFILGEEVGRFEETWAAACVDAVRRRGVGTAALTLALQAAGIGAGGRGDRARAHVHRLRARRLHAGVSRSSATSGDATGLIDLDAAAAAVIGPRTAAILAVHLYGQLCDMPALERLAARHGCAVRGRRPGARRRVRRPARRRLRARWRRSRSTRARTSAPSGTAARSAPTTRSSPSERGALRDLGQRRKGEQRARLQRAARRAAGGLSDA